MREHAAQQGVDDGVEDEVVRPGGPRQLPGVAQQHVVDLVQHQHHQLLGRGRVAGDETGVDQQPGVGLALHRCGGHGLGLHHIQQAQQPGQGVAACGHAIEEPVLQRTEGDGGL